MAVPAKSKSVEPKKKASAVDLLAQLGSKAKVAPKKATKERNILVLDEAAKESFIAFAEANQVGAFVTEQETNLKAEVCEYALKKWAETLFASGSRPANPQIAVDNADNKPDITAVYQVQDRFSVKLAKDATAETAVQAFVSVGLSEENATSLVENEIDFNPITNTRPLNELISGRYGENRQWIEATAQEQELGERLLTLILENFEQNEIALIIEKQNSIKPKAGFLDRVASYCETVENVQAVLSVVKPVNFPSSVKYGISDDPQTKATRLVNATARIIGVEVE